MKRALILFVLVSLGYFIGGFEIHQYFGIILLSLGVSISNISNDINEVLK